MGLDSEDQPVLCNKLYKNKDSLRVHMKSHRGVFNYKCKFCGKSYTTAGNKNDHERRHLKEKPFLCIASQTCNNRYYRKYELLRHIARCHESTNERQDKPNFIKLKKRPDYCHRRTWSNGSTVNSAISLDPVDVIPIA